MNKLELDQNQLLAIMCCLIEDPDKEYIRYSCDRDRLANPHGDTYKPKARSINKIIAQYKVKKALSIIKEILIYKDDPFYKE